MSPMEPSLRDSQGEGPGKRERLHYKGSWRSHIGNLTFAYDSAGYSLALGGWCQFKTPIGDLAKQNECQGRNIME